MTATPAKAEPDEALLALARRVFEADENTDRATSDDERDRLNGVTFLLARQLVDMPAHTLEGIAAKLRVADIYGMFSTTLCHGRAAGTSRPCPSTRSVGSLASSALTSAYAFATLSRPPI